MENLIKYAAVKQERSKLKQQTSYNQNTMPTAPWKQWGGRGSCVGMVGGFWGFGGSGAVKREVDATQQLLTD